MSGGWVAGAVRGRALATHRLGRARAREVAASGSLADALSMLARSSYGRALTDLTTLAPAERAVRAAALWQLRVLAGWLPPAGTGALRALAAWYEADNLEGRLVAMQGGPGDDPYVLGALATSWGRLAEATSAAQLRAGLASSPWGDPGSDDPSAAAVSLRLSWARRLAAEVPEATTWALGQAALLVAASIAGGGRFQPGQAELVRRLLGTRWQEVTSLQQLAPALARSARWVLDGVSSSEDLWHAGIAWWNRVESDGATLSVGGRPGPGPAVGAAAAMMADAWRVSAALQAAARGDPELADALG